MGGTVDDTVRTALTDLLADHLGPVVDTADSHLDDGWLTAHVALRAVEWLLDAAGLDALPDAVAHVVAVQRTSLVRSAKPRWDPGAGAARDRADRFLSCFAGDTRFFTNGHGYRSATLQDGNHFTIDPGAMFDTGIVMIGAHVAGLWWHAEGRADTPLGMSP